MDIADSLARLLEDEGTMNAIGEILGGGDLSGLAKILGGNSANENIEDIGTDFAQKSQSPVNNSTGATIDSKNINSDTATTFAPGGNSEPYSPKPPSQENILGTISLLGNSKNRESNNNASTDTSSATLFSAFTKILGALKGGNDSDPSAQLIRALMPFLSEERKKKATEAEKLIKLSRLIPILRESGIFSDLL